jgi:uncharacterized protein (TIGR03435 family)
MHRLLVMAPVLLSPAFAQTTFEVASIKRDPFNGQQGNIGLRISGNRLIFEHQGLAAMVVFAYGIEDFQLSGGPAWVNARPMDPDAYQLTAKAEGDTIPTKEQLQQMLQALLADRFQLKIHREAKDMPAYELVIAKNGHKLKDATTDPDAHTLWNSGRAAEHYSGKKVSMTDLVFLLRTQSRRPVIDKTGLTGKYDFELEWSAGDPPPPDAPGPSIFTAVQEQLGLKLESVKASFPTVVIDHAERPSEN